MQAARFYALSLALLGAGTSGSPPPPGPTVELSVTQGVARLLADPEGPVEALTPRGGRRRLGAPAWLETGGRAALRLRWPGIASARSWGRASLELHREPGPRGRPLLGIRFLDRLVVESRRALRVESRLGWSVSLTGSVVEFAALPDGRIEVACVAGRAVRVRTPERNVVLRAGGRLILAPVEPPS